MSPKTREKKTLSKRQSRRSKAKPRRARPKDSTWKIVPGRLQTRWAAKVRAKNVWTEYPRPQLARKDWLNLNGLWDYAIRPKDNPQPDAFDGKILVPFAQGPARNDNYLMGSGPVGRMDLGTIHNDSVGSSFHDPEVRGLFLCGRGQRPVSFRVHHPPGDHVSFPLQGFNKFSVARKIIGSVGRVDIMDHGPGYRKHIGHASRTDSPASHLPGQLRFDHDVFEALLNMQLQPGYFFPGQGGSHGRTIFEFRVKRKSITGRNVVNRLL